MQALLFASPERPSMLDFFGHLTEIAANDGHDRHRPHWVYDVILQAAQALHGEYLTIVQHTAGAPNGRHRIADNDAHEVHIGFDNRNGAEHWVALAAVALAGTAAVKRKRSS